ncbi:MAG: phosphonate metabolism transcriptional regulator PhnF [Desulfuromonadales bacterium]|nr:phosphonate metabolism transcriptional regulator PhnF [Desulfuromonadales bacterium]
MQGTTQATRYQQISAQLGGQISTGHYAPGEQLPTEKEMSTFFSVNRHTIREAIKELKNDGLIYSIRGKGTFVSTNKIIYRLSEKVRFTQNILEANRTPGSTLIDASETAANAVVAEKLGLKEGSPVLKMEIFRTVNDLPFSVATSYLPAERFRYLPALIDGSFSLYALLKKHFDTEPQRRESIIETRLPDNREVQWLRTSPRQPLLVIKSLAVDQTLQPVEYVVTRTRGDLGCLAIDFTQLSGINAHEH